MTSGRSEKLTALQTFMNLETGIIDEQAFDWENRLYECGVKKKILDEKIFRCRKCPGLNIRRFTEACAGWGNMCADIMFVGQSLHKPGVKTGLPFICGSGYLLDAALRLSGLLRKDVFISNVVHCHPPGNRRSTDKEKQNCLPFLQEEVDIVQPKLLIRLGNDAKEAPLDISEQTTERCFTHPASFMYSAPEERYSWIVKLSKEIDKVLK